MTELRLGLTLMEEQAVVPWLDANRSLCATLERDGINRFETALREYMSRSKSALLVKRATDGHESRNEPGRE